MERLLMESAVRAVLIALATGLVLWGMQIRSPRARHAAWTSVLVLMLLLPALMVWGPRAALHILPSEPEPAYVNVTHPASMPAEVNALEGEPAASVERTRSWGIGNFLAGVYLAGLLALLFRLAIGMLRTRRLIRSAVREEDHLTSASCSSPITAGLLKPVVILPDYWKQWPASQLDAVLTHEQEHVRRHDPLIQWLALLNRTVFWFHPLAWWLERRLTALAEEACDAVVLARGHDAQQYSEYLLSIARSISESGCRTKAVGLAMPGSFLSDRIRKISAGASLVQVSRWRMVSAIVLGAAFTSIFAAATLEPFQALKFEVASVKPAQSIGGLSGGCRGIDTKGDFPIPLGRCVLVAHRLNHMVQLAYGLPTMRHVITKVAGDPEWLMAERFDVEAKAENPANTTEGQLEEMLQRLLAERFKLRIHRETSQVQGFALVVGKDGSKLREGGTGQEAPKTTAIQSNRRAEEVKRNAAAGIVDMNVTKMSMEMLAQQISVRIGVPVVDRTALTGLYDFRLFWNDSVGPSMTTAVQEQLGLRLVSEKLPFDSIVIDHAEKPISNEALDATSFEVASVKPNAGGGRGPGSRSIGCQGADLLVGDPTPTGRCVVRRMPLRVITAFTYDIAIERMDQMIMTAHSPCFRDRGRS